MADKYISLNNGALTEVPGTVVGGTSGQDGKLVALDPAGRLDTSIMPVGIGADTFTGTASEALAAGDLVYIKSDGTIAKASAGTSGNPARGFVKAASSISAAATMYFEGRNTGLSGLTPGARYYLSDTTPGGFTDTPVTGAGKKHQLVGTAVDASSLDFEADDYVVLA